jgi:hypothetical protein
VSEIWKKSNLAAGYEVSNLGNVRMASRYVLNRGRRYFKKAKTLKIYESSDNYQFVVVFPLREKTSEGKAVSKKYFVHRLVMDAFVGPCPEDMTVDHIDRNRHNNALKNLRYATKAEQDENRDLSGISGDNSKFSKLDSKKVKEIRGLHTQGKTIKKIAEEYDVSPATIGRIIRYETWKD